MFGVWPPYFSKFPSRISAATLLATESVSGRNWAYIFLVKSAFLWVSIFLRRMSLSSKSTSRSSSLKISPLRIPVKKASISILPTSRAGHVLAVSRKRWTSSVERCSMRSLSFTAFQSGRRGACFALVRHRLVTAFPARILKSRAGLARKMRPHGRAECSRLQLDEQPFGQMFDGKHDGAPVPRSV